MVDCVRGDTYDGTGEEVVRVDCETTGKDYTREMRGNRGGAAEGFFNAGVEVGARV